MASISEVGHAKNIAHLNLLNTHIRALGNAYQPANHKIELHNLEHLYHTAFSQQELVNSLAAPYWKAVKARQELFRGLNKELSKLRITCKAIEGISPEQLEEAMSIIRAVKGDRKPEKVTASTDKLAAEVNHSVSQLSFELRVRNMGFLILFLQGIRNYNPGEPAHQIAALLEMKAQMLQATKAVNDAFVPLHNAGSSRNYILYHSIDNLVKLATAAKDYLYVLLDGHTGQYRALSGIRFRYR